MEHYAEITTPGFYHDVGFDIILDWLAENCQCSANEAVFLNLIPASDPERIAESQELSSELLGAFQRNDSIPLDFLPDISQWLPTLEVAGSQLKSEEFRELHQVLIIALNLKPFFNKNNFPLWHLLTRSIMKAKPGIQALEKVFDEAFQMKPDASPKLKILNRKIRQSEEAVHKKMQDIFALAKNENWLQEDHIAWRNGRSVLPLRVANKRKIKGIVQDHSASGQTAFIEPLPIIELNNQLTELQFALLEEKNRILREITAFFRPLVTEIQETFFILKHLDLHHTLAHFAHRFNCIQPEVKMGNIILLENAVNPLFTLDDKEVVALNLKLEAERTVLLSGPNAGGKTVVLKSLGLYGLMAQCGIFIPAKKARLPVFTQFMADIGDRQSIHDDLSTFSAHIQNLSKISENAHENTLVLLDELGTGTDPSAGAALSRAILEALLQKNSFVAATTHLGTLKAWAAEESGILNGGMVFDSDALAPTYELQLGTPGASYALEIANRMGLGEEIIKRARGLIEDGSVQLEEVLARLEKDRIEAAKIRKELEELEISISAKAEKISSREMEIDRAHKQARSTAAVEAEEIVLSARREAENLIAEIREKQADKSSIKKSRQKIAQKLTELKEEKTDETDFPPLDKNEALKGVKVYIPGMDSFGKILYPPDKKQRVTVETGGIKLTLKLSELEKAADNDSKKTAPAKPSHIHMERPESLQIDLRGKRVDEALLETEKFLDSALVSGLNFINILHGKGTGALMDAIHDYLKTQSFVTNYHFADDDQGGAGITVVELK